MELAVGDTVTRETADYLVDRVVAGFSDGQTWKLAHLAPSGGDGSDAWLSMSPGALEVAWVHAIAAPESGVPSITVDGAILPLNQSMSSLASVESTAGSAPGVLVRTWRYRTDDHIAQVECWPDGALVA